MITVKQREVEKPQPRFGHISQGTSFYCDGSYFIKVDHETAFNLTICEVVIFEETETVTVIDIVVEVINDK